MLDQELQDLRLGFVTLLRILQQAGVLSPTDISTLVGDHQPKRDREGEIETD
jgi:hypothetical protein